MNAVTPTFNPDDLRLDDVVVAVIVVFKGEIKAADLLIPDNAAQIKGFSTKGSKTAVNVCRVTRETGGYWTVGIAYLGRPGNNHAARLVTELKWSMPALEYVIMCGIGGAVPKDNHAYDEGLRPGDLVVSDMDGVLQYDFGEETFDETVGREVFDIKATVIDPGYSLPSIVGRLRANDTAWKKRLEEILKDPALSSLGPPGTAPKYSREHPADSKDTRKNGKAKKPAREGLCSRILVAVGLRKSQPNSSPLLKLKTLPLEKSPSPRIGRGVIGSANRVLMNPRKRDALYNNHKVRAIDMESAGIAEAAAALNLQYLIVRGVADFCDSEKAPQWQAYAATVAASFVRAVIAEIRDTDSVSRRRTGPEGEPEVVPEGVPTRIALLAAEEKRRPENPATPGSGVGEGAAPKEPTAGAPSTPSPLTNVGVQEALREISQLESVHDFRGCFAVASRLHSALTAGTTSLDADTEYDALYVIARIFIVEGRKVGGDAGQALIREASKLIARAGALNG